MSSSILEALAKSGSYNVARLKIMLSCLGVEPERIRLERILAVEAPRFVQQVGFSRLRKKVKMAKPKVAYKEWECS